ncbi:MAG: hypothetical protein M3R51_10855 [Candidatus Eremiobacteraeota bacterium]|nr:hypothetical protein [Candidatus Eremiobacteraeota bacterium]
MDYWFEAEVRARYDHARSAADSNRLARLAVRGRTTGVRARLANYAQVTSDLLEQLAMRLRGTEAV